LNNPTNLSNVDRIKSLKNAEKILLEVESLQQEDFLSEQLDLCILANDSAHAIGQHEKALKYARHISFLTHRSGYWRQARSNLALNKYTEAVSIINEGLAIFGYDLHILLVAIDVYIASGDRSKSLEYAQLLIQHHPSNWKGYSKAITNLIILGRAEEAREIILQAKTLYSGKELPQLLSKLDRYLKEDDLTLEVKKHIFSLRDRLHALFSKNSSCLPSFDILNHSDYILVANNSALTFNEVDCQLVKEMVSPLFIYSNLGNPSFCNLRHLFWHDGCSELLYGRTQHVATTDGRLIFKPFDPNKFLGCYFIKEGVQHWINSFSDLNNSYSAFLVDDIRNIIRSGYPESLFYDSFREVVRQRAPTMGWYMVSLFDALSTFAVSPQGVELGSKAINKPRVWTAGFTLSPSYIFEAASGELHDHIFERAAIEYRNKRKMTRIIGSENNLAKQFTGKYQLEFHKLSQQ
jgi:tetratricopeptide (TPR) repeat protein